NQKIIFRTEELQRRNPLSIVGYQKENINIQSYSGLSNFPDKLFQNTGGIYFADGINMPVPGNSGAIVIDSNERVVGLFYGVQKSINSALFIKINYIFEKLNTELNK